MLLHHKIYGQTGPWLIIAHGLFGSGDNWASVAKQLSVDFRVLVPDLRNHGASPHRPIHNYAAMADDLRELMLHLEIEKAHLIGHSMGGKAMMHLALSHPDNVDKLIVVDIAPRPYEPHQKLAGNPPDHQAIIEILSQIPIHHYQTRQEIDNRLSFSIKDEPLRQFLLKNVRRATNNHFEWKINLDALNNNLHEIMDGFSNLTADPIAIQTLFIKGEQSSYITDDDIFTASKLFPNAQLATINDAGHWVHADQPEILIKTIRSFL